MMPLAKSPGREPESRLRTGPISPVEAPMVSPRSDDPGLVQPALPGPGSSEAACGVEGHADEPKREAFGPTVGGQWCHRRERSPRSNPSVRGFAAERERRQRLELARAGIKPGHAASTDFCQSPHDGWRME